MQCVNQKEQTSQQVSPRPNLRVVLQERCQPQRLHPGRRIRPLRHQQATALPADCPFHHPAECPLLPHRNRERRSRRHPCRRQRRPTSRLHRKQACPKPNQANGASPFTHPRTKRNQSRNPSSLSWPSCTTRKMKTRCWMCCGPPTCFKT